MVLLKELTRVVLEYTLDHICNSMHMVEIFEATGMMIKDDNNENGQEGYII